MSLRRRWKSPRSGTCRVCGCMDRCACDGGCEWVDRAHTLCSACAGTPGDLAYSLQWIARLLKGRGLSVKVSRALATEAFKRAAVRGFE